MLGHNPTKTESQEAMIKVDKLGGENENLQMRGKINEGCVTSVSQDDWQ